MRILRHCSILILLILLPLGVQASDLEKTWVFFTDKGPSLQKAEWHALEQQLSERARWRRAKVYDDRPMVDMTDVPVHVDYLQALQELNLEPLVVSKWLNAVSVYASPQDVQRIEQWPFVERTQPVARAQRRPVGDAPPSLEKFHSGAQSFAFDYGKSFDQNAQIMVPELHSLGITGKNVLVAVFDTGFTLEHEAFDGINIVDTYDFINNDDNVDNEPGDHSAQNSHGTKVLSILAGFAEGHLIGPAFDADFLLAKTEDVSSETQVEEDNWIAAAEWAEQLGAEIITSSLGYIDWYEYEDMDGRTAPITLAADMAVDKGVVVVTSAGNEGDNSWYYITAPADGFDVIAVGAVTSTGSIAGFSSRGPTADGRIKPEVVAMGVGNAYANPGGTNYSFGSGTSFSCPMVSGVAALILSAHPGLTPKQVRQALIQTASQVNQPDNVYGFGLINALDAVNYWGSISDPAEETKLIHAFPNPFSYAVHDQVGFLLDLKEFSPVTVELYNILGQHMGTIVNTTLPGSKDALVFWNGVLSNGKSVLSGVYLYKVQIGSYYKTGKLTILQ